MNNKIQAVIVIILLVFAMWIIGSYVEVIAKSPTAEYGELNFFTTVFERE